MLLTILPINKKIQVDKGDNLYKSIRNHGIDLGVCSGNKTCGKCKVLISKGNASPLFKEELDFVVDELKGIVERLRGMSPLYEDFIRKNAK